MPDQTQTGTAPAPLPLAPNEGEERPVPNDPRLIPEDPRYATPQWRREPTSEYDPRKGR